jgi:hypothetical protein
MSSKVIYILVYNNIMASSNYKNNIQSFDHGMINDIITTNLKLAP